jgi:uncharacterized membrane protein
MAGAPPQAACPAAAPAAAGTALEEIQGDIMNELRIWSLVGLIYGTVLGLAAIFGGLGGFLAVLIFGVIGYLAGRALDGDLDLNGVAQSMRRRAS